MHMSVVTSLNFVCKDSDGQTLCDSIQHQRKPVLVCMINQFTTIIKYVQCINYYLNLTYELLTNLFWK